MSTRLALVDWSAVSRRGGEDYVSAPNSDCAKTLTTLEAYLGYGYLPAGPGTRRPGWARLNGVNHAPPICHSRCVLFHELVATSAAVAEASSRLVKIERLAALLRQLTPAEVDAGIAFLSGEPRQGRIGIGPSALHQARPPAGAPTPGLHLLEVDEAFERIAATAGPGSSADRVRLLRELLARAASDEQDFLFRLIFGELRQGALERVLLEAVARAAGVPAAAVRRAVMMAGELAPVAHAVLVEGEAGLSRFIVQIFRPVQPMLAQPAEGVDEALTVPGPEEVALEWKIDGARIQVHKAGDKVKVFSRNLREVTLAVPEVVETARYALSHGLSGPTARLFADITLVVVAASIVVHGVSVTPLMRRYSLSQRGARSKRRLSYRN